MKLYAGRLELRAFLYFSLRCRVDNGGVLCAGVSVDQCNGKYDGQTQRTDVYYLSKNFQRSKRSAKHIPCPFPGAKLPDSLARYSLCVTERLPELSEWVELSNALRTLSLP